MVENAASWLEFATKKNNRNIRLIDPVLVTGWHKTTSWACVAFSQRSREMNLTFDIGAGTMQGGAWGRWSNIVFPGVYAHSGPVRASVKDDRPSQPPSDKSPTVNADIKLYVFIHQLLTYYKLIPRSSRSERMEEAYQRCAADVQALGQRRRRNLFVTNQCINRT